MFSLCNNTVSTSVDNFKLLAIRGNKMYNIVTKLFCARLDGEQTNLLYSIYTKISQKVYSQSINGVTGGRNNEMSSYCTFAPFFFFFFYETIAKTRSFLNRFRYIAATIKKKKVYTMLLLLFLFFTYILWVHFCCIGAIVAGSGTNAVRWCDYNLQYYYIIIYK